MEQQALWQMDSLSLVVFVIAQDFAIGVQRLLQARLDDQRVPGSLCIGSWCRTRSAGFLRVLRGLVLTSSSCLSGTQFLYPQFRCAKFLGHLLLDFGFQSLQKRMFSIQRRESAERFYQSPVTEIGRKQMLQDFCSPLIC